jgi:hypothetical protein
MHNIDWCSCWQKKRDLRGCLKSGGCGKKAHKTEAEIEHTSTLLAND